ncbi:MAG: ribokinase [Gammaproteobacteria bacterium]|nr:ribokinase [Gammaproteobacteria bacterium]
MNIAVLGSINIDITTYADRLPAPGETLHGDHFVLGLGGKGCNQAAAAAALGASVSLLGAIGDDNFADLARAELASLQVPTDYLQIDGKYGTGIAVIAVDSSAQNAITVIGGANMALNGKIVCNNQSLLEATDILLLQMEVPLDVGLEAAQKVRNRGGRVILDPAPAPTTGYADSVYQSVDVMTPNETEAGILTGITPTDEKSASEAASLLVGRGLKVAIVKLGARGVWFTDSDSGDEGFIPAFPVNSIDSVAAGDCFNGGLAYAMADGRNVCEAVRFAAACGALSTTRSGAAISAPSLDEVQQLLIW